MSGLVMGLVWELDFNAAAKFERPEKYVLLAYADHADQNGGGIWPSIDLIAKKTGYSERMVQMITRDLEIAGYLVRDGLGQRGTNRYRIPVKRSDGGAKIAPLPAAKMSQIAPEEIAPPQMSQIAPEEIAPEGIAPEPSVVVKNYDDDEEKISGIVISDELETVLTNFGVFKSIWPDVKTRLEAGWTEIDLQALMAWMRDVQRTRGKAAQGFATRVREGTKAPKAYYPLAPKVKALEDADEEVDAVPEPAYEADGFVNPGELAWGKVIQQFRGQIPAKIADALKSARVDYQDGLMRIRVRSDRDWMADRLTKLVQRGLIGVMNREVRVEFVSERA